MDTTITTASEISVPDSTKAPQSPSALEPSSPHCLPEEPVVVIAPNKSWSALNPRDLWAHRELLYFLTWRDLKVRYKQTVLGVGWVVMQPLLTTAIFTVFLGYLVRLESNGIPYPLFALHRVSVLIVRDENEVVFSLEDVVFFEVLDAVERRGNWHGTWPGAVRPDMEWRTEYFREEGRMLN